MAFIAHHDTGAPCWFELGTTDQAGAKSFYSQVFGWATIDFPIGPAEVYTMFQLEGHDAAAAYTLPLKIREQGVPPHWGVYFAAPEVDAVTAKVSGLGGTVVQPPFDVMDVGRMSICRDPSGAVFSLWQEKRHLGAGVMDQDNSVCWVELATRETSQARDFYTALLGWTAKPSANMPAYLEYSVGGRPRGGLLPMDENWPKEVPAHWSIYVMVADVDSVCAKAKELGGQLRFGPFDAPGVGRIASIVDPQGAAFYVIKLSNPM